MSGKDLRAVLAMIVPTLILIAAIAFAVGASSEEKGDKGNGASIRAKPQIATQKRMRDPWERQVYAKTSIAPRKAGCDARKGKHEAPCF